MTSVGYVGTRTDGTYTTRNLNYAESGGNANRKLFTQAGTATINVLAGDGIARYNSLQVAVNRPFRNGFLLKGAYTLSRAMNVGDDDGAAYPWPQASQFSRNYAPAGFDRTHVAQMGFVYEIPFMKTSTRRWRTSSRTGRSTASRRGCPAGRSRSAETNGGLQQSGRPSDDQRRRERQAWLRRSRARRAVVRPGRIRAAGGGDLGQQRPQPVPRARQLEPGRVALPHDSDRVATASRSGSSRTNMLNHPQWGNAEHELHGSELHEDSRLCVVPGTGARRGRCSSARGSRSRQPTNK